MVFPKLLSATKIQDIPKMIAINSVATVTGTVIGIIISMTFGFLQMMIIGGLCYLPILTNRG